MPIFRRPSLDDRRRLVIYSQRLGEEATGTSPNPAANVRAGKRNQAAYGSRVQRRLRARWYGLVPVKRRTLIGWAVVLFAIVGVLGILHWAALWWAPIAAHPDIARPLRLDRPDSFGTWFSAVLLLITAGASFLVYQLRRYRSDDYHGHYRIWRIAILLSLISSVDCVTGLVGWMGGIIDIILAERDFLAGADWVRLLLGFGGAAFGLRMVGEVARNRASAVVLSLAFLCFSVPLAVRWNFVEAAPATIALLVPIFGTLGRAGITLGVVIYLRMLYREVRRLESGERVVQRWRNFFQPKREAPVLVVEKKVRATRKPREKVAIEDKDKVGDAAVVERRRDAAKPNTSTVDAAKRDALVSGQGSDVEVSKKTGFWERFRKKPSGSQDLGESENVNKRVDVQTEKQKTEKQKTEQSNEQTESAGMGRLARWKSNRQKRREEREVRKENHETAAEKNRIATKPEVASTEASESQDLKKVGWFGRFGRKKEAIGQESTAAAVSQELEIQKQGGGRREAAVAPASGGARVVNEASQQVATKRQSVGDGTVASRPAPAKPASQPALKSAPPAPVGNAPPTKQSNGEDEDFDDDQDVGDEEDVDPDSIDWGSLSKSERRRMRKVLKRQGKAA